MGGDVLRFEEVTGETERQAKALYHGASEETRARIARVLAEGGPADRPRRIALRLIDEVAETMAYQLPPLPCRRGCASCCTLPVHVSAQEVFGIIDYIQQQLPGAQGDRLTARIRESAQALSVITEAKRRATRRACPLLEDGKCTVYSARPMMCRAFHSTDRVACEAQRPEGTPMQLPRYAATCGVIEGYLAAVQDAGQDANHWELIGALAEALDDGPAARQRAAAGQLPFRTTAPIKVLIEDDVGATG